ncbi:hypothetical protein CYMTET_42072 [Cymbomonas tetramitiformis]|uniref:Haem-binding uptake Tiki superfamily ChaN domain-containing protein n=1 Tax=Cymbomonas tetramitiformis TaxID=36881 RepID=A0AAE0C662_9CHLO|nr:hypothetical protein CYMTET_42072 [Cymbomonas tetramitiformis]
MWRLRSSAALMRDAFKVCCNGGSSHFGTPHLLIESASSALCSSATRATSIIGLGCAAGFTCVASQAKAESGEGCPAHRAAPRVNTATSCEEEIAKSILPQAGRESTESKESGTLGVEEGRDFQVYDHTGARVSMEVIIDSLTNVEVLFLGEYHDDPIAHALEYEIYRRAVNRSGADGKGQRGRGVSLSLEMFERDTQDVMNDYLKGRVLENDLMRDARPWPNYSDYRPMVELARSEAQHVICANAPRRYVSLAGREGRNALPPSPWLPPLPYPSPSAAYVEKTNGLMAMAASELSEMRAKRQVEIPTKTFHWHTDPIPASQILHTFLLSLASSSWSALEATHPH